MNIASNPHGLPKFPFVSAATKRRCVPRSLLSFLKSLFWSSAFGCGAKHPFRTSSDSYICFSEARTEPTSQHDRPRGLSCRPRTILRIVLSTCDLRKTYCGLLNTWIIESDPLSRFFLGERPSSSRMAPIGAAQIVGTAFIAHRMRISHNPFVHVVWWSPQSLSITVATGAAIHNHNLR